MTVGLLDPFRTVAEAHEGVHVKGKKTPYTAINGNMFAFISAEGALCLRFDEATRAELAAIWGTGDVRQYGAVMRGYVAVPDALAGDEAALTDIFARSLTFAKTLPAKPTRRS